jgi:hypothetical protein
MKRLSTDIEQAWYDFYSVFYNPFFKIFKNVKIGSILGDSKRIEWIWKEWETWKHIDELHRYFNGSKICKIKDMFFSGEIDLIAESTVGEVIYCWEINGPGHNPKNDMAKYLLLKAGGIILQFNDGYPDKNYDWGYLSRHKRYLKKESFKERRIRKINLLNEIMSVKQVRNDLPAFIKTNFLAQNKMKVRNYDLYRKSIVLEMESVTYRNGMFQDHKLDYFLKSYYGKKSQEQIIEEARKLIGSIHPFSDLGYTN